MDKNKFQHYDLEVTEKQRDFMILKDLSTESDHEKITKASKKDIDQLKTKFSFLQTENNMHNSEIKIDEGNKTVDLHDGNCRKFISSPERQTNFIKSLNTKIGNLEKEQIDSYNDSTINNLNPAIYEINLRNISTKDHDREQQPNKDINNIDLETKQYQNTNATNINANNCIINSEREQGEISDDSLESCLGMIFKDPILTKNKLINKNFTVNNKERSEIKNSELNIVPKNFNTLKSFDEDLNLAYEMMLTKNFNDWIKGKEKKIDPGVELCKKICKELAYNLEIILAKYSDTAREASSTEKIISQKNECSSSRKISKELTCFKQSLERLNSQLVTQSKTSDEKLPSCSFHQQDSRNTVETPSNKYNCRSKSSTKLSKGVHSLSRYREFHNDYKHTSKVSFKETTKCYSSSKTASYEKLHKNGYKLSYNDHECNFEQFPEKKIKDCFKKCCMKRHRCTNEMDRCQSEKAAKFNNYNKKLDYHSAMRNISKSHTSGKELRFTKPDYKNYSYCNCFSHQKSETSNLTESNKKSSSRIYSRMDIKKKLKYKLQKHENKKDINSDKNVSSANPATKNGESTPVQSNPKHLSRYANYFKAQKTVSSVKKKNSPSRKMRLRKSIKGEYETGTFHRYGSDSDFYKSVQEKHISLEKEHCKVKPHKKTVENKRISTLISRQINEINRHLSRKNNLIKSVKDYPVASNAIKEYEEKDNINETNILESTCIKPIPIPEDPKKMKTNIELGNRLFKKSKNYNAKQESYDIADSSLPVEQMKYGNEKKIDYSETQIFDVRHGIHDATELNNFESQVVQACHSMTDDSNNKSRGVFGNKVTKKMENEIVENGETEARVTIYSNSDFHLEKNYVETMKGNNSHDELKSTTKEIKNKDNQLEKNKNTKEELVSKQIIVITIDDSDGEEEVPLIATKEYEPRADFLDKTLNKSVLITKIQDTNKTCSDDIAQKNKNNDHKELKNLASKKTFFNQIPIITIDSDCQEELSPKTAQEYKCIADSVDRMHIENRIQENQTVFETDLQNIENVVDKLKTNVNISEIPAQETRHINREKLTKENSLENSAVSNTECLKKKKKVSKLIPTPSKLYRRDRNNSDTLKKEYTRLNAKLQVCDTVPSSSKSVLREKSGSYKKENLINCSQMQTLKVNQVKQHNTSELNNFFNKTINDKHGTHNTHLFNTAQEHKSRMDFNDKIHALMQESEVFSKTDLGNMENASGKICVSQISPQKKRKKLSTKTTSKQTSEDEEHDSSYKMLLKSFKTFHQELQKKKVTHTAVHSKINNDKTSCEVLVNSEVKYNDESLNKAIKLPNISNITKKYAKEESLNGGNFQCKRKIEDITSNPENNAPGEYFRPSKIVKTNNHNDVHSILKTNDSSKSSSAKLQSNDVTSSTSIFVSPMKKSKYKKRKETNYLEKQVFGIKHKLKKQKSNLENASGDSQTMSYIPQDDDD